MRILMIEDDEIDSMIMNRILKKIGPEVILKVIDNAVDALKYLNTTQELPNLILLDLNLPKMNGFEFIEQFRKQIDIPIPIVILTTSDSDLDRWRAYRSCAMGYITKTIDTPKFTENVKTILNYWKICNFIS